MYIYIHIYIYVYIYIYIFIRIHVYMHIDECISVNIYMVLDFRLIHLCICIGTLITLNT
jgi:hypothetical protein